MIAALADAVCPVLSRGYNDSSIDRHWRHAKTVLDSQALEQLRPMQTYPRALVNKVPKR